MDSISSNVTLVLGSLCVLAVLVNMLRGRFEFVHIAILLFGFLLIGMPLYQSISWSISPGSVEGKFEQSIGAAKADTNADLEKLKKELVTVNEKIDAIAKRDPVVSSEVVEIGSKNEPSAEFVANGKFTVLVFYKEAQADKARKLVTELLSEGYKSSAIVTDLSEAKTQLPSGSAWIVWQDGANEVAQKLKTAIARVSPTTVVTIRQDAYDLNRGDVQILLF